MAFPQVSYDRLDALLTVTRAFPAQNTTVNSSSIDLGTTSNPMAGTKSDVVVTFPATTTPAGQTFTFGVQHSSDNVSFVTVPGVGNRVNQAATAQELRWRLPDSVLRYVRLTITASATTGDQTAAIATLSIRT